MANGMDATRIFVEGLGLPLGERYDLPSSPLRFPDGGQYRIEIPSVEGPNALRMVYSQADALGVPAHRVSQGSGVMLLTDDELDEMAALARERGIEISLFVGDRARVGTSA
jgi:catechol 2,3-dioxygenase-like lactoylglutathione lyase family enzyme